MTDSFSVTVSGQDAVIAAIEAKLAKLQKKIDEAIQGAGIDTAADAKQHCPVDTGRLRSSIQYVPRKLQCKIGTNVEYAWYQELGTSKMAAHPFLFPAFVRASQNLKRELEKIL